MTQRPPTFSPIAQLPNLTGSLADTIQAQIEAGDLSPGQRLPTEQAIVASTGVSRTVVREALATLRARGLIVTRQGLGAFVAEPVIAPPSFSIPQPVVDADDASQVVRILELRLAIEVEAAGLAAERRGAEDLARLEHHLDALARAEARSQAGTEHDFAFHRALLAATGNGYFVEVLDVLGNFMASRRKRALDDMAASASRLSRQRLVAEHRAILDAVRAGEAGAAKRAMRAHLRKAFDRYTARGAGSDGARPTASPADHG